MKRRTPKLGQHFLTSRSALAAIIDAADISPDETVLEIGPGKGVLTEALLKKGVRVIAVEKDQGLAEILNTQLLRYIAAHRLTIVSADIREVSPLSLGLRGGTYKVVANIPYYITGEILRHFLESDAQPRSMTLLVQDEVARRVATGTKESILSLSVKVYGTPRYVKKVPRGAFSPAPRVDSAIIHIEDISKKNFSGIDEKHFFTILRAGFSARRKQLIGNLSALAPRAQLEVIFSTLGLLPTARAEDVSLRGWLALARALR